MNICIENISIRFDLTSESWSTPAFCKVNNKRLLIAADKSGTISAFDIESKEQIWNFQAGARVTASPSLADVNSDGIQEVIIGAENGLLFCLGVLQGNVLWQTKCGKAIRSTAAVVDVNNDGLLEVIITGFGTRAYCINGQNGLVIWKTYLPKHEFFRGSKLGAVSSPLVADVDLDGELEVVVGIRSCRMFCLSAINGAIKWFAPLKYDPDSSPSFAVVDGKPLVVFGGGEHVSGFGDNAIIALNGNDGSQAWRTPINGGLDSCPVIADIDNDGKLEVVICSLADASCTAVKASSGKILWRYFFGPTAVCNHDSNNVCTMPGRSYFTQSAICRSYSTPLILRCTRSMEFKIFVGSNNGQFVCLEGASGKALHQYQARSIVRGSAIMIPGDKDYHAYIAVVAGNQLLLFNVDGLSGDWRMFKGGLTHEAQIKNSPEHIPVQNLPGQRMTRLRLFWHWIVIDIARYLLFQFEIKVLRRFGIKLFDYYY